MPIIMTLSGHAFLVQDGDGSIFVNYDGSRYRRNETVPFHIMSASTFRLPAGFSAGDFVTSCMLERFGPSVEEWSEIARAFLFPDVKQALA
jgi:hypothetical protein